jgi:hypothetical protein
VPHVEGLGEARPMRQRLAACRDNQRLAKPLIQADRLAWGQNVGAPALDTMTACPPLSPAEAATVAKLKADEEARLLPERERKRSEWSLPRIKALVASGVKEPEARAIVNRMIDNGELHGTFVLQFDGELGDVKVSDVVADPARFVGKTLSDPHEGPAYGCGKAILYRKKNGSLFVNSFAHGGRKYDLLTARSPKRKRAAGEAETLCSLRGVALRAHRAVDYMTKITAAGPQGDCPIFLAFLDRITAGDHALVAYLRRVLGYALTGATREHALFFGYGTGANGKSVLLSTVAGILGDYHKTAPIETFTASNVDRHPTDLARQP